MGDWGPRSGDQKLGTKNRNLGTRDGEPGPPRRQGLLLDICGGGIAGDGGPQQGTWHSPGGGHEATSATGPGSGHSCTELAPFSARGSPGRRPCS